MAKTACFGLFEEKSHRGKTARGQVFSAATSPTQNCLSGFLLKVPDFTRNQDDFNCSSLPAGLGGNGEFERKLEEFLGK